MGDIVIEAGSVHIKATLFDTPTAAAIEAALPIEASANLWGDEIYFSIPVKLEQAAGARAEVELGQLGYWPAGDAFCIFFGPTPASHDREPRAASPVNVFGQIQGDLEALRQVRSGANLRIRAA
jgi:hypothetical protein